MKKILLVGSTGLVGQAVLSLALVHPNISQVIALTRTPLLMLEHPRLINPIVDFEHLPKDASWWMVDAVICTLGTTIKKAGNQEAFRKVDFNYPLTVATCAKNHGATAYALNSAAGANPDSRIFYLKTKGELEHALTQLDYPSLSMIRPALIDGNRAEFRLGEKLSLSLCKLINPLLPPRYRSIHADKVAISLLNAVMNPPKGIHIIEAEAI